MAKLTKTHEKAKKVTPSRDKIKREYAGKFIAWEPSGKRIVAVANTFDAAEKKAAEAGHPMVAVVKVPKHRTIG